MRGASRRRTRVVKLRPMSRPTIWSGSAIDPATAVFDHHEQSLGYVPVKTRLAGAPGRRGQGA